MFKVLDEKMNDQSGMLERVVCQIGNKDEPEDEESFSQIAQLTVIKEYYKDDKMVHAEMLYNYTKPENLQHPTK